MNSAGKFAIFEVDRLSRSNASHSTARFDSREAVARAMRLESVRRLASLQASVRQLSLFNAQPDACVLQEIAALEAGIALLDEATEPEKLEKP